MKRKGKIGVLENMESSLAKAIYVVSWIQLLLGVIGSFILGNTFGTPERYYPYKVQPNGKVIFIALVATVVTSLFYFAVAHILENSHRTKVDTQRLVQLAEKITSI